MKMCKFKTLKQIKKYLEENFKSFKNFELSKSNVSESKYLNFQFGEDEDGDMEDMDIRISNHDRPAYDCGNGSYENHEYLINTNKVSNINEVTIIRALYDHLNFSLIPDDSKNEDWKSDLELVNKKYKEFKKEIYVDDFRFWNVSKLEVVSY